jgi:hypothetical protein
VIAAIRREKSINFGMFGSSFVIFICVALKVVLKSAFLQHVAVFIEQSVIIGVVLSGPIADLREVVETLHGRLKRTTHKVSPREVPEPRMLLYFLNSSPSQSLHWLPLEQLVGEIRSFNAPALRNVPFRDDHLLLLDLLLDLLSRFAQIRSLTHHDLVNDDSQGVEVDLIPMALVKHHLRSHVTRCPRSVL